MKPVAWTLLLFTGLAGGYHGLLGRAHLREIDLHNRRIEESYDTARAAEEALLRLDPLHHSVEQLVRWRATVREQLHTQDEGTPAVLQVSGLFAASNLKIERAEVLPNTAPTNPGSLSLHIAVVGAFSDLFRAIEEIENARPLMRVLSLSVISAAAPGRVRADMTLARFSRVER